MLVDGVTGSGKTEVYLRAIEDVLAAGRWRKREGRILTIDPSAARERLRAAAESFWNPQR